MKNIKKKLNKCQTLLKHIIFLKFMMTPLMQPTVQVLPFIPRKPQFFITDSLVAIVNKSYVHFLQK